MDYNKPFDQTNPAAGYVNGNPATNTAGSIPCAEGLEYPQREIVNAITQSGQGPTNDDLTQLWKAILAGAKTTVLPYTPAGARYAETFTGANAISNFVGGATGSYSGPFTTVSSITITGASYLYITGTCGFRAVSSGGTDCRARIRTTIQGKSAVVPISYQGCRAYSSTQIPVSVALPLPNLDRTKSVFVELIVDRTENDAQCVVQDPRLFIQHDGNP